MRLVFFGTSVFAVPILTRLADSTIHVVTQPDRPSGRGLKMDPTPVKACADSLGIPVISPSKIRTPEFLKFLQELNADAFVVAAYGRILPTTILDTPRRGCLNLHGSILPSYRGAAPIQRSIQDGHTVTGVTLMQMDEGMDTGNMLAVAELRIGDDEVYGALQDRLAVLAADLAAAWIPGVIEGKVRSIPQNHGAASLASKIEKAEAELRFEENARSAYNKFRAFTPSPGAFLTTHLGVIKLTEVRYSDQVGEAGQVLALKPHLTVGFHGGSLELRSIRPEGRKAMAGSDWANGARLHVGQVLKL